MKKLLVSLLVVMAVVAAPTAAMARNNSTNGYWEPYTVTERVAFRTPVTRYVCDQRNSHDYWYGRDYCYYTTEFVTRFRNQTVTKYRWVEYTRFVPVRTESFVRTTQFERGYITGYNNGFFDGSYGRSYNPYGYQF